MSALFVCLRYPSYAHLFIHFKVQHGDKNNNQSNTSKMQDNCMATCSPNRFNTTGGVAAAMQ